MAMTILLNLRDFHIMRCSMLSWQAPAWQERYMAIEEVLKVRRRERDQIAAARGAARPDQAPAKGAYPVRYDYGAEAFAVRRKEFWPLPRMESLLTSFIPNLSHESDGLIFQARSCLSSGLTSSVWSEPLAVSRKIALRTS